MKNISVFCGSSSGSNVNYVKSAVMLGKELAKRNIRIVYGGGKVGMMGALAKACLENGGSVTGVIPQFMFDKGLAYDKVKDMRVVPGMHERKKLIHEISDAFIALPGGYGTLEEILEALTWAQLGIHHKPCGLLNVDGYFDKFLEFLNHATKQNFIHANHRNLIIKEKDPKILIDHLISYQPTPTDKIKWISGMHKHMVESNSEK